MWIFTKTGFYSVVQKPEHKGSSILTVRARSLDDLRAFCQESDTPESRIRRNTGTDYPYRVTVPRCVFANWLSLQAYNVDYPNFKNLVHSTLGAFRSRIYARVWAILTEIECQGLSK